MRQQPSDASALWAVLPRGAVAAIGSWAMPGRPPLAAVRWVRSVLLALSVVGVLGTMGCSGGYPEADVPLLSPFDMDNAQRVSELNAIGQGAHPQRRWTFALDAQCRLRLDHKRKGSRSQVQVLPLDQSTGVKLAFDKTERTFDVRLLFDGPDDAKTAEPILQSPKWTQASRAELLLQLVIRDCARNLETSV